MHPHLRTLGNEDSVLNFTPSHATTPVCLNMKTISVLFLGVFIAQPDGALQIESFCSIKKWSLCRRSLEEPYLRQRSSKHD